MKNKLFTENILIICFITVVSVLNTACTFPDKLPAWENLFDYKLEKLRFGITTIDDFSALSKCGNPEKISDYSIFTAHTMQQSTINEIRVGFKGKKLDWIEYVLKDNIELLKIQNLYGIPQNINSEYSNVMDYYDYMFFNIATGKDHKYVRNFTFFEIPQIEARITDLKTQIPDWKKLNNFKLLDFKIGSTTEADFIAKYPALSESKKDKSPTASIYTIRKELDKSLMNYNKIELIFGSGLLECISLTPKNMLLDSFLKAYKNDYKLENINNKYSFYEFSNFTILVDKETKKIVNIGLVAE